MFALHHWWMESEAYRDLKPVSRCLLHELMRLAGRDKTGVYRSDGGGLHRYSG